MKDAKIRFKVQGSRLKAQGSRGSPGWGGMSIAQQVTFSINFVVSIT
jgi:hypothetical protein